MLGDNGTEGIVGARLATGDEAQVGGLVARSLGVSVGSLGLGGVVLLLLGLGGLGGLTATGKDERHASDTGQGEELFPGNLLHLERSFS